MSKGGGKSAGKILGSIVVGIFSGGVGLFGSGMSWMSNFMLGASLFSSIWTATHKPDMNTGSATVNRFDKIQETMSSTSPIQVVYGRRKISGNQTYHKGNSTLSQLHKHVVLCEGGIEGIESVTANELLIPTGTQTANTVISLMNTKYSDAHVRIDDKHLYLTCNGNTRNIYLCTTGDMTEDRVYDEWQVSISSLISYINRLGEGWQAFPVAATSQYPGNLHNVNGDCYLTSVNLEADTVRGGTNYTLHDCEAPDNYEEVGGYPNLAWLDMNFTVSSELNGNPNVTCTVLGRKVYDPRTGKTEYSTNPALCLRDFILSKRYGLGRWFSEEDLDNDSWMDSADYCDEIITFLDGSGAQVQAKRYELNMIIDEKRSALEWLQEILANFCGYIVYSDGLLKLKVERETPISYRFNDDSCFDLKIQPLTLDNTPNHYEVSIVDPLNNWSVVKCLVDDYADQKRRQKITTKEVSLEGVTSQNQALRLARFYRDYNLVCPLQLSFTTGLQAMHLEPGDVVTVSYHNVFNGLPIRITEIKETNKGTFEISGRQYNDTIYGDILSGGIHWYNYSTTGRTSDEDEEIIVPSEVTHISANTKYREYNDGSRGYDIEVKYDLPVNAETVLVYYQTDAVIAEEAQFFEEGVPADELGYQQSWKSAGESPSTVIINGAHVGDTYKFYAVARSVTGHLSSPSRIVTAKVTKRKTIPSRPYNFKFDYRYSLLFTWDDVKDSDVLYYELRLNQNVGDMNGLIGRTNDKLYTASSLPRFGKVYLYAINSDKMASQPSIVEWNVKKLVAPELTYEKLVRGAKITVPFTDDIRSIKLYISGANYSNVVDMYTSTYNFFASADIYDVVVEPYDIFGAGYRSYPYQVVVDPTFNAEWIKDGTLSIAKVDNVVKDKLNEASTAIERLDGVDEALDHIDESISELKVNIDSVESTVSNKITQEISQVKQTASSIQTDIQNLKTGDISQLKQTASSLQTTVQTQTGDISQLKQTANSINTKVQNLETNHASLISQNANSISSIVTALGKSPAQSGYSAITQLQDAVNLRVQKGDIINQINLTAAGTKIDGKYLHITATTAIDNDLITSGMIKANAITADKINVSSLSAICATIGTLRTKTTGARVEISDNLIQVFDANNTLRVKLGVW